MKGKIMQRNCSRVFSILFVIGCLFIGASCNRTPRPDDLPKLYPCVLTVMQEQAPLAGALVNFHSENPSFKWTITGVTDLSGLASMKTHGNFQGVPEGEYIVTISKTEIEQSIKPKIGGDGTELTPGGAITHYHLVDKQYSDPKTSPLRLTVQGRKIQDSFDLGKPVRQKGETIRP